MADYSIILAVTLVGLGGAAIMALAIYLVDKNADRYDKRKDG